MLLPKALGAGWRVAVRSSDPLTLERLDTQLWDGDGFLPHGLAGGPHDAHQPILLTTGTDAPNEAKCLMILDGASVSVEEAANLERVCLLFEGANETAVAAARDQWKSLTEAGIPAVYWSEETGAWTKKAESGSV